MLIFTSMIVWCLVLDERSDLWPLLYLAEELFLLRLHSQSLMTSLLPRTTNLHAPVSIYLSSDDLISSDIAHGPIPISEPFIPTSTFATTILSVIMDVCYFYIEPLLTVYQMKNCSLICGQRFILFFIFMDSFYVKIVKKDHEA